MLTITKALQFRGIVRAGEKTSTGASVAGKSGGLGPEIPVQMARTRRSVTAE